MRWAILGIGRVTPRMVQAIRGCPGDSLVRVAARDPIKLARWQQQHSVACGSTDFLETIEADDIDAVYVALPPSEHARWSIAALERGKRVLCEKPLAANVEDAVAMLEASRRTQTPLVHATGFPFHPRSAAIRSIVQSGDLGKICRVTIACSFSGILERPGDHRTLVSAGGGCLLDLGWYCVYATAWLTGQHPTFMQSIGTRAAPGSNDSAWEHVQTVARLSGGAVASWDCGYDAAGRKWIEIAGTRASVICDDFIRPWDLDKPRFWVHGQDGKARSESMGEGLLQETRMVEAIETNSLHESLESLELAVHTQRVLSRIEEDLASSPKRESAD